MSMSIHECQRKHRELWFWLEKNPSKMKQDWPGFKIPREILHDCFPCQFVIERYNAEQKDGKCDYCPADWPDGRCLSHHSPYNSWVNTLEEHFRKGTSPDILKRLSEYARAVRQIPWKKL